MCQCSKTFARVIFQEKECPYLCCMADKLFRCHGRTWGEQWDYNVWENVLEKAVKHKQ